MDKIIVMEDLVSVIIPVYSYQPYLIDSIRSIMNQSYKNLEIIIVSDDKECLVNDVISSLNDTRIKLIKGPGKGLPAALNKGIMEATGTFLARMDSDDIALKDKFVKQLDFLKKNKLDICGTNIKTIGSTNYLINFPEKDIDIKYYTLFGSPMAHPSVIGKISSFREHLYNESFSSAEDYELWVRMAKSGIKFGNLQEPLLLYRVHSAQASKNSDEQVRNCLAIANDYSNFFFNNETPRAFINTGFGFYPIYQYSDVSLLLKAISKYAQIYNVSISNFERQVLYLYSKITDYSFKALIGYYRFNMDNCLKINFNFTLYLLLKCFYKRSFPIILVDFLKNKYK